MSDQHSILGNLDEHDTTTKPDAGDQPAGEADSSTPPGALTPPGPQLVSLTHPRSIVAEAYRELRTSLSFSRLDKPIRSFLVTSSGPNEGKSTTASNLAVVIAQGGSSVVIIDADLRRASLDRRFGVSNQFGLTNALFDPDNLKLYIRSTPVDNLRLLTSGPLPPNPSELLGSDRMADVLHRLQDEFDMVILDTPPVASVADALVLAHRVDGVVLVVEGSVRGMPRDVVQRAKNKLDQVKANILGVVLNKVDLEREQPYYYYYNYSAAYYMGGDSSSR